MKDIVSQRKYTLITAFLVFALATFVLGTFYAVFVLNDESVYQENGLIENTQAIMLVLACVAFLIPSVLEKKPEKIFFLFSLLVCYAFVIRELDVEKFSAVPEILKLLMHGSGRTITLGVGLLVIIVFVLRDMETYKKMSLDFMKGPAGKLLFLALALLLLGDFFEKMEWGPHYTYFEEISELCGYVVIFLTAYRFAADSLCNYKSARVT